MHFCTDGQCCITCFRVSGAIEVRPFLRVDEAGANVVARRGVIHVQQGAQHFEIPNAAIDAVQHLFHTKTRGLQLQRKWL